MTWLQSAIAEGQYLRTAGDYFGEFGPPRLPRRLDLTRVVARKSAEQATASRLDPEIVTHWLSEFAARAECEQLRLATL